MQAIKHDKNSPSIAFCVLLPTYNNQGTLSQVIEEILTVTPNLIIINDGSTDSTAHILSNYSELEIIHFKENKGKGKALRIGFSKALELGFNYAVSIDSDGQHDPKEIPKLIEKAQEHPGSLIMGSRNMKQAGVPTKSSFGNKFSSFWYQVETFNKLSDTQTGFRAYPLHAIANIHWVTNRFEFEVEVIVRLAWELVPVYEVPISVKYEEDRVSHFRPFKDFMRISALNTILFTLAILFYLPRKIIRKSSPRKVVNTLKAEFKKNSREPAKMASSIGLGLFIGIFPIWGFQMLVGFSIATYFKMNRVVVLLFANVSLPPLIPFIILLSYVFGSLFVADPIALKDINDITSESIYLQLKQYLIGASLLAALSGLLGFLISYSLLKLKEGARKA